MTTATLRGDSAGSWKTMERRLDFPCKDVKQGSNMACFMVLKTSPVPMLRVGFRVAVTGQK